MKSVIVSCLMLLLSAPLTAQGSDWLMAPELETRLAQSGAPPAVGPGASVYLLTEDGYRLSREGTNGFSCMVRRLGSPHDVLPICFDAAASESVMPVYQEMVVMLMGGMRLPEILPVVWQRYQDGTYEPPAAGSVAYMMSAQQKFFNAQADSAVPYFPHVMVYRPHLTMDQVGGSRDALGGVPVPFVAFPGTPGSYMMIPTGPRGTGVEPGDGM